MGGIAGLVVLGTLTVIKELMLDEYGWMVDGWKRLERETDRSKLLFLTGQYMWQPEAVYMVQGQEARLGEGVCVSKRTFISLPGPAQPLSLMMPAAEEDSVAMRRKLNFIIALPYLMSVSQAAGDVLMNLELYSL